MGELIERFREVERVAAPTQIFSKEGWEGGPFHLAPWRLIRD